jgi:RNA polymerase sigma-70 factor (ECF subfamily)
MPENVAQLEAHRTALTGHCYRMLGSAVDADDAVQETLIRAWKSLGRFDERASLRTWLYKIATNVCLDALADRKRRARPMSEGPAGTLSDVLTQKPREHWIEPVADARALPADADPSQLAILKQSIRLAFVAALQHLAPKQRAALLLTEVLGWSATEVAETLETSVAAVNSALQRARATLAGRKQSDPVALSEPQTRMLDRYVEAFERYEVDTLASLLREDATFSMPPYSLWLQGPEVIRTWLMGPGTACRGSRLVPTAACGSPAFGQYRVDPEGGHKAWALIVLELSGNEIAGWNSFLDVEAFFPRFDLPMRLVG